MSKLDEDFDAPPCAGRLLLGVLEVAGLARKRTEDKHCKIKGLISQAVQAADRQGENMVSCRLHVCISML